MNSIVIDRCIWMGIVIFVFVFRREITAQEIAAQSRLSDGAINGSNAQLNTGDYKSRLNIK